ncbi:gliding motility protein [Streptomyces sp. NA02950]|uniref:gliding motility protein n=1 Tax=Streptomyces sp. NA02950 TaxID=2742137 RepID=UPI0020CA9F7D|nr:gliding motility protein [Streptomyces sp. NA02950]
MTAEPAPGTATAEDTAEAVRSEEETVTGEGAGIPKQLSAQASADSEAGESART